LKIEIDNLDISINEKQILKSAFLEINSGEVIGIFGDSGSGKSVFCFFIMGFLNNSAFRYSARSALFINNNYTFDLTSKNESLWCDFRKKYISIIFQDPTTSLNPTIKCGYQMEEYFYITKNEKFSYNKCIDLLKEVGIDNPQKIFNSFPHEISGGQKQRVVIAMSLLKDPKILIADEPTTSLDPITQKNVLDLIIKISKKRKLAVLLISHNIELLEFYCNKFYVYKNCKLFDFKTKTHKNHIKSKNLIQSKIKRKKFNSLFKEIDINGLKNIYSKNNFNISLKELSVSFNKNNTAFKALDNIHFDIKSGENVGIAGGSGSGKTTLGRLLCGLESNFLGDFYKNISFEKIQLVYQDPFSSFNPKIKIRNIINEIIKVNNSPFSSLELLKLVGLKTEYLNLFPSQISGGEKQRLSIARVLASSPDLIIFDESLSGLDLDIKYTILNLIRDLNIYLRITIIFISHDLNSLNFLCNKVYILNNGKIIDNFNIKDLKSDDRSPYTKDLLNSNNLKK
tara:strand:+ start:1876 stop:3411 length:1536 start_codon:yes stop_codon:yes gene_type:complete